MKPTFCISLLHVAEVDLSSITIAARSKGARKWIPRDVPSRSGSVAYSDVIYSTWNNNTLSTNKKTVGA